MDSIELSTVNTLNKLRQRLLDLTARNKLLNFNRQSKQSVQIVDESASFIFRRLLEEKYLRFLAIEAPTMEALNEFLAIRSDGEDSYKDDYPTSSEWAKYKNINIKSEFSTAIDANIQRRHVDDALQTPYYEMEMDNRLRTLHSLSHTALLETGSNVLFLAFGFLQWFDKNGDKMRLAPLLLMPIHLKKGVFNKKTHCYEYRIYYSDEELVTNISLKKRLQQDFDIELPEVDAFEYPELYLHHVEQMLFANNLSWQIKRFCYIAPFNFSKLVMYKDLDPNKWADTGNAIESSPLVQSILLNLPLTHDNKAAFCQDHVIDELDAKAHKKYPVVYSADSSQHSALIDVLEGKNLVIEGPPGTGKSQTIANIIAAAMNEGKSVLFVAEKRAALEVVKQKLTDAELDKFCLEIHSHKTSRKDFIESIRARLNVDDKHELPANLQFQISAYEDAKAKLLEYYYTVDTKWQETGLSVAKILSRASCYQCLAGNEAVAQLSLKLDGNSYTPVQALAIDGKIQDLTEALRLLEKHRKVIDDCAFTLWQGVSSDSEKETCLSALSAWVAAQKSVSSHLDKVYQSIGVLTADLSVDDVVKFPDILTALPTRPKNQVDYIFPLVSNEQFVTFEQYADDVRQVVATGEQLAAVFQQSFYCDVTQIESALASLAWFSGYGVDSQASCGSLKEYVSSAQELSDKLQTSKDSISQAMLVLMAEQSTSVPISQSIAPIYALLRIVEDIPNRLLSWRQEDYEFNQASTLLTELKDQLQHYRALSDKLSTTFNLSASLDLAQIKREAQLYEDNRGFFCWLKPAWYRSRKYLKNLAHIDVSFKRVLAQLTDLYDYLELQTAINNNSAYKDVFAKSFEGVDSNIEDIELLHFCYQRLFESDYGHLQLWHRGKSVLLGQSKAVFTQLKQGYCNKAFLAQLASICEHFHYLTTQLSGLPVFQQTGEPLEIIQAYRQFAEHIETHYTKLCGGLLNTDIELDSLDKQLKTSLVRHENIQALAQQNLFEHNVHAEDILSKDSVKALNDNQRFIQSAFEFKAFNLYDFMLCAPDYDNLRESLIQHAKGLKVLIEQENQLKADFVESGKIILNRWLVSAEAKYDFGLKRNVAALSNELAFDDQRFTARCMHKLSQYGLFSVMEWIEQHALPPSDVQNFMLAAIYSSLARDICYQYPHFNDFSVIAHEVQRKEYQTLDTNLLQL